MTSKAKKSVTRPPVFLHSSFRTSSTWFFECFRQLSDAMAFCEPFNEQLGELTLAQARNAAPTTWVSGHPGSQAYYTEMFPLFTGDRGVSGFNLEFPYKRFVPKDGLDGTLDEEQESYVKSVLGLAWSADQIPVFASTRSLGRLTALKQAFGGVHIFIYRNIYDQWASYISQYLEGNPYFLQTVTRVLNSNNHVPAFRKLEEKYWQGPNIDAPFAGFRSADDAFCAFLGLHLYLYLHAFEKADFALNTTRVCSDQSYRQQAIDRIETLSGLRIDLADARRNINYVGFDVSAQSIEEVLELTYGAAEPWLMPDAKIFGQKLIEDILADSAEANIFAKSSYTKLANINDRLQSELLELNEQIYLLEQQIESKQSVLLKTQSELNALQASSSWKITAPLRKAVNIAGGFRSSHRAHIVEET